MNHPTLLESIAGGLLIACIGVGLFALALYVKTGGI